MVCSHADGMRFLIYLAVITLLAVRGRAEAAQPGVPALPSTLEDYYGYAVTNLPDHFKAPPVASTNNTPLDNQIANASATLGRVLFYDPRLSHDDSTSCSSCHQQQKGFSDPNQKSEGINGQLTARHSMGLSNASYYARKKFFWDERAATLEDQVLQPIQSPVEMGMTLPELRTKLASTVFYPTLFTAAFGDSNITDERISKALAQFVRSMVSYKSKYDSAFTNGVPNFAGTFTQQELDGQAIFHGGGKCSQCHTTDAQVGNSIHNIGLDAVNTDTGAMNGRFKTPSLRNVAELGRYMHDGRFSSLEEVVEFYNSGVQANPYLDGRLQTDSGPLRLNLTEYEKSALVAFMRTLTDTEFLTDAKFSNPFVALPGDYDANGTVNADDFVVWRASFGSTSNLDADGNLNGTIDAGDYAIWRNNFGKSWLSSGAAAHLVADVPEPAAFVLLMIAVGLGGGSRRRRIDNPPTG